MLPKRTVNVYPKYKRNIIMDSIIISNYFQLLITYLPTVLLAVIMLVIGFTIIGWVSKLIHAGFQKRNMDPTVERFLTSLVTVGLKVMLLLSVAGMFGIQTTSFIAIFTALAFAVGTALSGSLGHFASGVMLLTFRPYKVGDLVTLAGQTGTVEEVQMFNTVLMTPDNKRIMIPNGLVTSSIITNISGQGDIRVDMDYAVGNAAEIEKVRAIITEVGNTCPTTLKDKPVDIFVSGMTPGGTKLVVRPWSKSEHYWDTYFYYQENIRKGFALHGIPAPLIER
jgi:small conductance mechanosensitive channel